MEKKFDEMDFEEKSNTIKEVVQKKVAPMLAFDGGSCEVVDIKEASNGIAEIYIRYLGACQGCASAGGATIFAIEDLIRREVETTRIRVLPI